MTKFSDLALDPRVLQAVSEAGYEIPTPIQAQAIPEALKGRDVLGIAQTGTGKTASFVLPMITILGKGRARARMPRSLVLAPTRELAAQVAENFDTYAKHTKLTKALLIGGVSFGEQDKLIDRGVDVLIATPGRLLDHFERGKLLLNGVQIMVVDEADRMLDMGFIPDIERIFQLTPFTRQTLFFSATMAPEIERITNTFLTTPAKIEVARQATASTTITQALVPLTPSRKDRSFTEKRAVLRALIAAEGAACTNAIIFCNRKMDVDVVAKSLKSHGFNAAPIHGDLDQSQRTKTLDEFRDGTLHLLVASDVAARGLDIPAVSHVFNFDVPSHPEDYVHRIGRTGRAGRMGKAFTIAVPSDDKYLKAIESLVKAEIPRGALPEGLSLDQDDGKSDRPRAERGGRTRGREDRGREDRGREERAPHKPREARAPEVKSAAEEKPAPVAQPREEPRRDRRDDRRDRRDDRREHGGAVVGMGDHVPDFILQSFKISSAAKARIRIPNPRTAPMADRKHMAPHRGASERLRLVEVRTAAIPAPGD
ncbi:MAG: DEAD/DEAH box helicase [Tabrizicola sp.]|nr:DEAD/DEAH box helicase [Tabrizicola sp.]